jgi:hypothetical protein
VGAWHESAQRKGNGRETSPKHRRPQTEVLNKAVELAITVSIVFRTVMPSKRSVLKWRAA